MKPIVLQAQVKDLLAYIKTSGDLNKNSLIEINKKLLKIMMEVSENLEKVILRAPVKGLFAGDETVTPNGASDIQSYFGRKRAL